MVINRYRRNEKPHCLLVVAIYRIILLLFNSYCLYNLAFVYNISINLPTYLTTVQTDSFLSVLISLVSEGIATHQCQQIVQMCKKSKVLPKPQGP